MTPDVRGHVASARSAFDRLLSCDIEPPEEV
jgi:hypothetical protein